MTVQCATPAAALDVALTANPTLYCLFESLPPAGCLTTCGLPNGRTRSTSSAEWSETQNTLWYASRVRRITNNLIVERAAHAGAERTPRVKVLTLQEEEALATAARIKSVEELVEQERSEHAQKRAEYETRIASLTSQLEEHQTQLELGASRELVIRAMLLAAEQRFHQREVSVGRAGGA